MDDVTRQDHGGGSLRKRPIFHFTASRNWLNDPNGLIYVGNEFHLFYQHNPAENAFGVAHWGHATSRDLVVWRHRPIALAPDELGYVYSGSAVVDTDNTAGFGPGAIVAGFTHHAEVGTEQQSIAYSTDGALTFEKYAANPVLPQPDGVPDFRDPRLLRWAGPDGEHWVMLLAVGTAIWIYTSSNLIDWTFASAFAPDSEPARVWECPDLFQLPVAGTDQRRWVMIVGVDAADLPHSYGTRYWVGEFDGFVFAPGDRQVKWADQGADFYAAQTWSSPPGDRRIWVGWMNNWAYAAKTPTEGWRGAMSFPRELGLVEAGQGYRLVQYPVVELDEHRRQLLRRDDLDLAHDVDALEGVTGIALDIVATVDLDRSDAEELCLAVRVGDDESTDVVLDLPGATISIDRSRGGAHEIHRWYEEPRTASLGRRDGLLEVRILVDTTSIELFADRGLVVITEQIFPSANSRGCSLRAIAGTVHIESLEVYAIEPAGSSEESGSNGETTNDA